MDKNISFTLKVWRQKGPKDKGHFDTFQMKDIPGDTSFLEMMDILNEQLINEGKEPIVFDHDCREGICGMCSNTTGSLPSEISCSFKISSISRNEVSPGISFIWYVSKAPFALGLF